ncbi:MAG: sulfatase [Spirochaetales bacterium]|nr:sulfatase [Spirochaetales bacterium]
MRAIMLMFDTLNLRMLSSYGCPWTVTPNFKRLAEKTITFDNCYAGSLPCMPARRELHTGRYNFLHCAWGPVQPYDDSIPEMLKNAGVYTHMISDHQHYWEDGGATYHHRYNTWEIVRGQEADRWKGQVKEPEYPEHLGRMWRQDVVNRSYITSADKQPLAQVFQLGLEFLEKNKDEDNWFLHWECFDPHEPFFVADEKYKKLYPDDYKGPQFDWPDYKMVSESPEAVEHCRHQYMALLSMCDEYLGKLLDYMDENDMWKDTALIVNTDHGFLLAEHDMWGKSAHPWYNEISHIPLFVWDPTIGIKGERRDGLCQNIDVAVTLLEMFGLEPTRDMKGRDIRPMMRKDEKFHDYVLFGLHGGHVNITDGTYVYMRAPVGRNEVYNYTLMPMHMRCLYSVEEMKSATLHPGFDFTKGVPLLKIASVEDRTGDTTPKHAMSTMLFDLRTDPGQEHPIDDPEVEERMCKAMIRLMKENDAPEEQYTRLGFEIPS